MKRQDLFVIVLAMVAVAMGALLLNHYAFSHESTTTTAASASGQNALAACESDGATVSSAIKAFDSQNPGITVTESDLIGNTYSGPYIQSWPRDPTHYVFTLRNGTLYVQAPGNGSKPAAFTGPASCLVIGL